LVYVFSARAYAPGQESVLSSPLVFGLAVALAVLILVGVALYGIIVKTATDRLYNTAVANLEDGDYRNALRRVRRVPQGQPQRPPRRQGPGPPGDGQRPAAHVGRRGVVVARAGGRAGDGRDRGRPARVPRLQHRAGRARAPDRPGARRPRPARGRPE